jgi:hypothetical protein
MHRSVVHFDNVDMGFSKNLSVNLIYLLDLNVTIGPLAGIELVAIRIAAVCHPW